MYTLCVSVTCFSGDYWRDGRVAGSSRAVYAGEITTHLYNASMQHWRKLTSEIMNTPLWCIYATLKNINLWNNEHTFLCINATLEKIAALHLCNTEENCNTASMQHWRKLPSEIMNTPLWCIWAIPMKCRPWVVSIKVR